MKRLSPLFLIGFLLVLSACGGGGAGGNGGAGGGGGGAGGQQGLSGGNSFLNCPSNVNTTTAAPESGSVTLSVTGFSSSPAEDNLVVQQLNAFSQLHPTIKVNWSPIAGDYPTKMRANVAAGNVADVFYLRPDMANEYITAGKVLNLSPYMQRDNTPASNYYPSLLTPFSCKKGDIYGIPKDWNSLGLFYNKTMFKAAGVAEPTDSWTWTDMQNAAKKLTKPGNAASAQYGITLDPDPSRWLAYLFADGGQVLNSDGSQAAFNSQAGIDSLTFFSSFQKDGTSTIPKNIGAGWAGDAFGKQRAAMATEGGWLIPYMKEKFPNVQYGIAPLPKSPAGKRADLIFTNAWAAYSGTKHADAAWQLIKYMTGPEVQSKVLQTGFALPTLKSLSNDPYFTSNPGAKVLFDAAQFGYADNFGPHDSIIHTDLTQAIEKVFLGRADVKTALTSATNVINTELQA